MPFEFAHGVKDDWRSAQFQSCSDLHDITSIDARVLRIPLIAPPVQDCARLPKDLIWVTTNANVVHNQIKALPIGMTDYCGYSPYHPIIGDTEKFKQHSDDHPRTEKNSSL